MSFLNSLTIVSGHIKKLSVDNSSETLTQGLGLRNLESGQSTVMNINRYVELTEMESLVTNHSHL